MDQAQFAPPAHGLVDFRKLIVKRQAITTVEVMSRPIHGRRKTHLMTGYVHKPYPPIYAMLARHAGFDSALIVRGVEGGVIPSLRQKSAVYYYQNMGEEMPMEIEPADLGIEQEVRSAPLPDDLPTNSRPGDEIAVAVDIQATAKAAADAGMAALKGETGPTFDSLVYSGALVLHHLGREKTLAAGADRIRKVLESGNAVSRVQ